MIRVRILIVEDHRELREMLVERLVSKYGRNIQITECESIATARAKLQSGKFELVISDRQLPDGDGEDIFNFLSKTASADSPYIMFTGDPIVSDRFVVIEKSKIEELFLAIEQFEIFENLKVNRRRGS